MFIQSFFRGSPSRPGVIPLAPDSSHKSLHATQTISNIPGLAIVYLGYHNATTRQYIGNPVPFLSARVFPCGTLRFVALVAFIVRGLYAGTLATVWTSAPNLPQCASVQLAAVRLLFATLTIAARCCAFLSIEHPLVQLNSDSSFSPIYDSNAQVTHSSNLALGSLFKNPVFVQSDISVIVKNSKRYVRTKRELTPSLYNRVTPQPKLSLGTTGTGLGIDRLGSGKRWYSVKHAKNNSVESDSGESVNISRVHSARRKFQQQNFSTFDDRATPPSHTQTILRSMPPVSDHSNFSLSNWVILVLVVLAVVLTVALGLITCVLSYYRPLAGEVAAEDGTATVPHDAARRPITSPMLSVVSAGAAAGVGGMDRLRGGRTARELAASRDRQVRLHAIHTDIAINLPPSIAMPDGEEHPFTSSRLHIRDPEQESEIHQKCVRPPPNRTVLESESPPPYRSSSAGLLSTISTSSTSSGGGGDCSSGGGAPLVVRCHSMSSASSTKRPEAGSSGQKTDFLQRTVKIFTGGKKTGAPTVQTLPVVIVPTRSRRTSNDQQSVSTPKAKPSV